MAYGSGMKENWSLTEDSDSESVNEEERIRKLFLTCDSDGDGYINCNDLLSMCKELNMEDDVDEIMHQLGFNVEGKISYKEFVKCRYQLKSEINALQKSSNQLRKLDCDFNRKLWRTCSDNSEGMTSFKFDSWEFDSGARDLSPEPNALRKLIEAAGENIPNSTTNLLEMANKLHLAALNSLKSEIIELNSRFQRLTHERDLLEKQLSKSQLEKLRLARDTDDRLEQQSQQYEERLTELHSVIAELSKKFENQKENIIREEDEMSQRSNDTFSQIISNDNNPNESFTDTEEVIGDMSNRLENISFKHHLSKKAAKNNVLPQSSNDLEDISVSSSDIPASHLAQMHILQSENIAMQEQLSRREAELNKSKNTLANMRDERDRLRKKIRDLQSKLQGVHSQSSQGSQTGSPTHSKTMCINSTTGERTPTSREDAPITKIAERIKLKKVESGDRHILGADFVSLGMSSTKVVEHLVRPLQDDSSAQEIFQSLYSSGAKATENCLREFEIEMERLNSKIDHLKAQNDLLTLTLEESKTQCNFLSVLIGKYESNCTAYQLTLTSSDQIIEAYDVVSNLLETETSLLLANCRAAGFGGFHKTGHQDSKTSDLDDRQEIAILLKKAQETRKNSELMAKHLVQKLDRNNGLVAQYPWDQMSTKSCGSGNYEVDVNKCDERRLREHIIHLKNSRNRISTTIMELESIHVDPLVKEPLSAADAQKFDLENAVLMQELMAIKEEKVELKAQVYLLERERASLELQIRSLEAQEQARVAHIEHLKSEMREQQEKNNIGSKGFQVDQYENRLSDASIDFIQELGEANQRELKLKSRIQELVSTLEKVTKNSDLRHQQSAEFVNDLKRANSALVIAFEKSKRKYQSKIKKLEQQMLSIVDRHSCQVRLLKQQIGYLEEEQITQGMQLTTSETSL